MARKSVVSSGVAMPSIKLKVCIFCGMPNGWKLDKVGRPYLSCGNCTIRVFPHGPSSIAGIELLHEMLVRSGIARFRQALQHRVNRDAQHALRKAT